MLYYTSTTYEYGLGHPIPLAKDNIILIYYRYIWEFTVEQIHAAGRMYGMMIAAMQYLIDQEKVELYYIYNIKILSYTYHSNSL